MEPTTNNGWNKRIMVDNKIKYSLDLLKNKLFLIIISVIIIFIVIPLLLFLFTNSNTSNTSNVEPDQNQHINPATGQTVVQPDGKVEEVGGGETGPNILGSVYLLDIGAPSTVVDSIIQNLVFYTSSLKYKVSEISVYKDSLRQSINNSSSEVKLSFNILVNSDITNTVNVIYKSSVVIDSFIVTSKNGNVLFSRYAGLD